MRAQDIKIGEYYVLREHPHYSYIKPIEILKPKQKENTNNFLVKPNER